MAAGSALGFLSEFTAKGVREAIPKLEFPVKRLRSPHGSEPPMPQLQLTFIDGKVDTLDLRKYLLHDIITHIELETGRLDLAAMKRGKPWL